jgi:hypothetical protein
MNKTRTTFALFFIYPAVHFAHAISIARDEKGKKKRNEKREGKQFAPLFI